MKILEVNAKGNNHYDENQGNRNITRPSEAVDLSIYKQTGILN